MVWQAKVGYGEALVRSGAARLGMVWHGEGGKCSITPSVKIYWE
jgi:hypothetical protein